MGQLNIVGYNGLSFLYAVQLLTVMNGNVRRQDPKNTWMNSLKQDVRETNMSAEMTYSYHRLEGKRGHFALTPYNVS